MALTFTCGCNTKFPTTTRLPQFLSTKPRPQHPGPSHLGPQLSCFSQLSSLALATLLLLHRACFARVSRSLSSPLADSPSHVQPASLPDVSGYFFFLTYKKIPSQLWAGHLAVSFLYSSQTRPLLNEPK